MLSIIEAAGWPIWPLIACSILALALIVERFISLRESRIVPPALLGEAVSVSRDGLPPPSVVQQLAENSPLGEVLASGLQALAHNPRITEEQLRTRMEATGRAVAHGLEKYLGALATIASAAPLLGLLGTVIGMIEIFAAQSAGGVGGNPAQLAHGISVALYNTAFGLIVAIPALVCWRHFRARADTMLLALELASEHFLNHLLQLRK